VVKNGENVNILWKVQKMIIDILQISRDARAAKRQFPHTIDGSIGMFIDDNGYVGGLPVVFETLKKMPPELLIPYPAVDGGQPFKDNVFSWIFQDFTEQMKKTMHHYVCATPGGSGAISAVFNTHVKPGESILVSDIRWQYDRFAEPAEVVLHSHRLFDGEAFDLHSFEHELDTIAKKQHRVVVIINDPCHNPSGYTLTLSEWDKILDILNRKTNNEIILLYDMAYIDYSCETDQREKARHLNRIASHVHVLIAFSGSKTFGAYGIRLGALVGLSSNKDWIAKSREKVVSLARGTWSCSPTPAIELLNKMLAPEQIGEFKQGLSQARQTIIARGETFLREAREANLPLIPYKNGFYVIVKCDNSQLVYEKLTKNHIYAVPVAQGIRMALCSMPMKDIIGLAGKLKRIIFES
jgi:aspartate/tyrosine/aromatic aminotransferase